MTDEDIAFADCATLQRLLKRRAFSSLELTNLYLARLEKYGGAYNAVVALMPERARAEASAPTRNARLGTCAGHCTAFRMA